MTQKVAIEVMICLDPKIFAIKTVTLESLVLEAIELHGDNMYMEMALIE